MAALLILDGCAASTVPPPPPIADVAAARWAAFSTAVLDPLVTVLLPSIAIFAVLLAVGKVITGSLVPTTAPGPQGPVERFYAILIYAGLGVAPLAVSTVIITLELPTAVSAEWNPSALIPLVAGVASLIAMVVAVRSDHSSRRVFLALPLLIVPCLLLATVCWAVYNDTYVGLLFSSALFGAVGVVVIGYMRGLKLRLLIEGRNDDGSSDSGIAQSVCAALQSMVASPPAGAMVPRNVDVTSMPDEALAVLPDGWTKFVKLLLYAVGPSKPWHIVVTRLDDDTVDVSILRNGRFAASQIIHPSTYGWPAVDSAGAEANGKLLALADYPSIPRAPQGHLCIAAAAFLTMNLARAHKSLDEGLNGAKEWESVAAQVIATDRMLSTEQALILLSFAHVTDSSNLAAALALGSRKYREDGAEGSLRFAQELSTLLHCQAGNPKRKLQPLQEWPEGLCALQLRLLLNISVALTNAALLSQQGKIKPSMVHDFERNVRRSPDLEERRGPDGASLWVDADWYIQGLEELLSKYGHRSNTEYLVEEIQTPARFIGTIVKRARDKGFDIEGSFVNIVEGFGDGGILGHFERACALAFIADSNQSGRNGTYWDKALERLEAAVTADQALRKWARSDPYLAAFRSGFCAKDWNEGRSSDSDERCDCSPSFAQRQRYRKLVGDAVASKFIEHELVAPHSADLRARGLTTAEYVAARSPIWLARELSVSPGVAHALVELARLHQALPPGQKNILVLCTRAGIFSVTELLKEVDNRELASTGPEAHNRSPADSVQRLADRMLEAAQHSDIVPPSSAALEAVELRKRLLACSLVRSSSKTGSPINGDGITARSQQIHMDRHHIGDRQPKRDSVPMPGYLDVQIRMD